MIKSLFLGRRAPGISRAACHAHLRDIHGPMVVCAPADAGPLPSDYTQNHVFDGAYPALDGPHAIQRDLATEIWSGSLEQMRAAVSSPYYLANMKPDEPRFVDDTTVAKMRVDPRPVKGGVKGLFKLFVCVNPSAATGEPTWNQACARAAAALEMQPGVTAIIDNHVVFPEPGVRLVERVLEAWLDTREAATALVSNAETLLGPFGEAVDRQRSFVLAAEAFTAERLRALYRQTMT